MTLPQRDTVRTVRFWRLLAPLLLVAAFLACGNLAHVSATTGATSPTPARYEIADSLAQPFRGQYNLAPGSGGARLISGGLAIDLNELGYLFGIAQFRTYDAQGHQTTVLVGFYNFHLVAHRQMLATIYDATDTVTLGKMAVTQSANGDLIGQLTLGHQVYPVHWHKSHSL
jgi:hypothetical protein